MGTRRTKAAEMVNRAGRACGTPTIIFMAGFAIMRGLLAAAYGQNSAPEADNVPGLRDWLRVSSLQKYEDKAEEWSAEMGAVSLKE
eukprot:13683214-Heterocapsa_arctica.AAC.1